MNIFHRFAAKSLKANRTRTVVTIVGIVLSIAMLTAVTSIVSSIQAYGIAYETKLLGDWHVWVGAVDEGTRLAYEEDERVERIYELQTVGYALLDDGKNSYKPYLCIQAMNEGFADNMPVHLTEGRMPENETEVLIPNHVWDDGGVKFSLGDTLTLSVGYREDEEGSRLWQKNALVYSGDETGNPKYLEHLTEGEERTYTVVGFYERPDFENYYSPGYTVLTMDSGEISSGCYECYIVMKHPSKAIGFWEEVSDEGRYYTNCNNNLLRFYGYSVRSDFNAFLYGMGGILILIIVFGSVALIYNAFAISVSERTKQFGLLSSIGATKRQMKKTVCFEAFILCLLGIPLGILCGICGIGITLSFFADSVKYLISTKSDITFGLSVSWQAIVLAAAIGMVTVLISAYFPMRRALKTSAIDAVRQHKDIRLTKKALRIPKWVEKCFGVEGMIAWKNFKRNKKQYRATIVSLALSILLFVSAGCFSDYLFGGYRRATEISPYDIEVYCTDESYENVQDLMEQAEGIDDTGVVYKSVYVYLKANIPKSSLTEEGSRYYGAETDEQEAIMVNNITLQFLPDEVYREMLQFYDLDTDKYLGSFTPPGVVLNSVVCYPEGERQEIQLLKNDCEFLSCAAEDGAEELLSVQIGDIVEQSYTSAEFYQKCLSWPGGDYNLHIIYPLSGAGAVLEEMKDACTVRGLLFLSAKDHTAAARMLEEELQEDAIIYDMAESEEQYRMLLLMLNVFCYGFIILISLISTANVFNTISTNMGLRRREFAMLRSVGLSKKGFLRMLNFECLIYGMKGLLYGFMVSVPVVMLMYYLGNEKDLSGFYLPWRYVVISVLCVFAVVYATMLYAQTKAKRENIVEELK